MLDIQISGVCERDIDLLYLEGDFFLTTKGYLRLVPAPSNRSCSRRLKKSSRVKKNPYIHNKRRVRHRNFIALMIREEVHLLLDENKVDANFQKDQVERYGDRGMGYVVPIR